MYHITISDLSAEENILYYPSDSESAVYDAELSQKVGECGEFTFKVPVTNMYYNEVTENKIITIYRDNIEHWRGFIREITTDFDKTLSVYCVEDLAWLSLEFHPPMYEESTSYQLFAKLLDFYNDLLGIKGTVKQFEIGYLDWEGSDDADLTIDYEVSILDALRLLDVNENKAVRVRRQNGKRYIDIVELDNYGKLCEQGIEFGSNILDYTSSVDTTEMFNCVYAYGSEIENKSITDDIKQRVACDPVVDLVSIAKYGRISRTVIFDGIDDVKKLEKAANTVLKQHLLPNVVLTLTALDLSELKNYQAEKINIGDTVYVTAVPYGFVNEPFFVLEKTTNLQDSSANTFVLSADYFPNYSITKTQTKLKKIIDDLPTESSILKQARLNALNLLNNGEGGYISYVFNDKNQMMEMHIANHIDYEMATHDWVWNINGLGYRERSSPNVPWDSLSDLELKAAITMDGQIVADFITTGIMSGDRIKGGELLIGGNGYAADGKIVVRRADNTRLMIIDKNGLTLDEGTYIAWDKIAGKPTKLSDFENDEGFITDKDDKDTCIGLIPIYYMQLSTSAKPSQPTEKVTSTSTAINQWTTVVPTVPNTKNTYRCWQSTQYLRKDKKVDFSEVTEYITSAITTKITQNTITTSYIKALQLEVGNEILMGPNAKISWGNITGKKKVSDLDNDEGFITEPTATQITKDTVTTSYVNALKVTAKDFSAQTVKSKKFYYNDNNYIQFTSANNRWLQFYTSNSAFTVIDQQGRIHSSRFILSNNVQCQDEHEIMHLDSANFVIWMNFQAFRYSWNTVARSFNAHESSDVRLKNSIEAVDDEMSMAFLNAFNPVSFIYNQPFREGEVDYGCIAQDLIENLESQGIDTEHLGIVYTDDEGFYRVAYVEFIPHLINVVKKQQTEIDELKSEVAELKDMVKKLIEKGENNGNA